MISKEEYKMFWDIWVHEDDLINHRLTWLLVSQALLFAAYGAILTTINNICIIQTQKIINFLPIFGIILCFLILLSTGASTYYVNKLGKKYVTLQQSQILILLGLVPPVGLPLAFIIAWVYILFQL